MQALTPAQEKALWFWLAEGHQDDPALRPLAVERVRELGDHAQANGIELSLEMYEDTFLGTADEAVAFHADVNHPAVGLNPDLGNFIRLHRRCGLRGDVREGAAACELLAHQELHPG